MNRRTRNDAVALGQLLFLLLGLTTALSGEAPAPDRTPAQLLGGAILLIVVAEVCDVPVEPGRRQALADAGERLQARVGLSNDEMDRMVGEVGAKSFDCARARARYVAEADALIAEARRIP